MNYADKQTDKELARLERRLEEVYEQAWGELNQKVDGHFKKIVKKYKKKFEEYQNGDITLAELQRWYMARVGEGERWRELRDQMADNMVDANKKAVQYINDATPNIYALNHNYTLYEIERTRKDVSFTLTNESAVRRLIKDNNHISFRINSVNRKKNYKWNSKRINNALTQGILQGDSPMDMSKRFYTVMESNKKAAIRNARTSFTSAQNGGRFDSFVRAMDMGIDIQKEWVATRDSRTRPMHGRMDGERQEVYDRFSNGLMYPGDPEGAPGEVYNCRCAMIAVFPGITDTKSRETYMDWIERKTQEYNLESTKHGGKIKMDLQYFATRIPKEKFTMYALNPNKAPDKAAVFEKALGYNLGNYKELIDNIERNIDESKFVYKRNNGFGDLYEQEMTLKGPNGKTARVMTAWIDRGTEKQLTSVYIKKSKRGKENENRNV